MEKNVKIIIMVYIGTTTRIHSFIPRPVVKPTCLQPLVPVNFVERATE